MGNQRTFQGDWNKIQGKLRTDSGPTHPQQNQADILIENINTMSLF